MRHRLDFQDLGLNQWKEAAVGGNGKNKQTNEKNLYIKDSVQRGDSSGFQVTDYNTICERGPFSLLIN